jgi:N-acetyltransferase
MPAPWIPHDLVLHGHDVRLEPLAAGHSAGLFPCAQDPEIWRFVPMTVSRPGDMDRYIDAAMADRDAGQAFPFAIRSAVTGDLLGSTRYYSLNAQHRNLEIGYTWLDPKAWRTAVNTGCKYLLLRYAFESLGCLRVALRTDLRNLRSQRAIERLGAVREGVFRRHMILPDGFVRDTVYYSITDLDWPRVKAFLENALRG